MRVTAARVGQLLVVVLLVTWLTALLFSLLPGDLADLVIPFGTDAQRQALEEDLHLDQPLIVQYGNWLKDFATGDLGNFYRQGNVTQVSDRVVATAPVSLLLILYTQFIAVAVSVPLAVAAAKRAGGKLDQVSSTTSFALMAIPNFVFALLLAYVVGVQLRWLPPQGYVSLTEDPVGHVRSMILPALSLAIGLIAVYTRILRNDILSTLQQDFIQVAASKGISERRVMWRHALRPSSVTLITSVGLHTGGLIGGAVVVELIFNLDGVGRLMFDAISERQVTAVQSLVALVAVAYVLANFLAESLCRVVDPRLSRG